MGDNQRHRSRMELGGEFGEQLRPDMRKSIHHLLVGQAVRDSLNGVVRVALPRLNHRRGNLGDLLDEGNQPRNQLLRFYALD